MIYGINPHCVQLSSYVFSLQTTAGLLHAVLSASVQSTFHKINVHTALTPDQIWKYFEPVIDQATFLEEVWRLHGGVSLRRPFVTVSVVSDWALHTNMYHYIILHV